MTVECCTKSMLEQLEHMFLVCQPCVVLESD